MNKNAPIRGVSWLERVKQSEPVRLYAYTVLAAVLTAAVAAGAVTGEWAHALTGVAAAVLGAVPAAEAARASVYSPRTYDRQLVDVVMRARGSWAVTTAEETPLR
jgi:hypothetical protein